MFKIIAMLLPFIKELFFDKKEEADFSSPYFNVKKWLMYVGFVFLCFISFFSTQRLVMLSKDHIKLTQELETLSKEHTVAKNHLLLTENDKDHVKQSLSELRAKCEKAHKGRC